MQTSEQTMKKNDGNGDQGGSSGVDGDTGEAGNGDTGVQGNEQNESTARVEANQPTSKQRVSHDGKIRVGDHLDDVIRIFTGRIRRNGDPESLVELRGLDSLRSSRLTKRALGIVFLSFLGRKLGVPLDRLEALRPRDAADPQQVVDAIFKALNEREFEKDYTIDPQIWSAAQPMRELAVNVLREYIDEVVAAVNFDSFIRRHGFRSALQTLNPVAHTVLGVHVSCLYHETILTDAARDVHHQDTRDFIVAARYLAGSMITHELAALGSMQAMLSGFVGGSRDPHVSYKKWLQVLASTFRETAPPSHVSVAHEQAM